MSTMPSSLRENIGKRSYSLESDNVLMSGCSICGGLHPSQNHQTVMADMPQEPVDLVDDLVKMRLYRPEALAMADTISQG